MAKAAGHILKGSSVKLEGPFHLDAGEVAPGPAKEKDGVSAIPQVNIVENQPGFAVIEITCSCGTKAYIRCEYAAAEPLTEGSQTSVDAAPDDAQNAATGNLDQEPDQTKIIGENENEN